MIALRSIAPKLPPGFLRRQKASSPPTKNGNLLLEPALVGREKADHAAEMVVMAVAQHHRVEQGRVDLEDRHVVEQHLRRIAEIDQHVARLARGLRFRMHGETPFAVERRARRRIRRGIAAGAALDGEAVALLGRDELDHDIVGDHAYGEPVDFGNGAARAVWLPPSARRPACHHGRHEARAAGAERSEGRDQRRIRTQGPNSMLILLRRKAASAGAGYFQQNLASASFRLRVA